MTPMNIFFTWSSLLMSRLEKIHLSVTLATVQGSDGVRLNERQALTPTDFHPNEHLKSVTEVKTLLFFSLYLLLLVLFMSGRKTFEM
jgi:hypothetical protein